MKQTKTALIMSFISLIFCVCMLIGTTFAWYTDSVTSGKNKIQAGDLSVDLVMADKDGNYSSVKDQPIFHNATFEPDEMQVVYLGVQNIGTLPLKYRITLDIVDNGLANALEYAIIDGVKANDSGITSETTWSDIKRASGGQTAPVQPGTFNAAQNGQLDEMGDGADNTDYFALAVHMDVNASSKYLNTDANHPEHSVTISVTVDAFQLEQNDPLRSGEHDIFVASPNLSEVSFDQSKIYHFVGDFDHIKLTGQTISLNAVLDGLQENGSKATINGNLILKPGSGGTVAGTIQNFQVKGYIYVSADSTLTIRGCTAKGIFIDDSMGAEYILKGNTFNRGVDAIHPPAENDLFHEIHQNKASLLVKASKDHSFTLNMVNNTFTNTEGESIILIQPATGTTSYTSGGLTFVGNDFTGCGGTGTQVKYFLSIQGDGTYADASHKALDLATQIFTRNKLETNTGLTVLFKNETDKEYTYTDPKVSQKVTD